MIASKVQGAWREAEQECRTLSAMLSALGLLCVVLFALCLSAEAQQPKKVHRIGYQTMRAGNATLTNLEWSTLN